MKFPLPKNAGYSRHKTSYIRKQRRRSNNCCNQCISILFKSEQKYSFKPIESSKTKLKTFDKWIVLVLLILLLAGILVVKSVLHLAHSSRPPHPLQVIDLQNNDNNDLNTNNKQYRITRITPKPINNNNNQQSASHDHDKEPAVVQDVIIPKPQTKQTVNKALTYNEFNDWFKIPEYEITDTPKYYAFKELQELRQDYIEKKILSSGSNDISGVANKIDENKCVVYNTDNLQWKPIDDDTCGWTNNALFWSAMEGTKIGADIRKLSKTYSTMHWMFDFKESIPQSCSCPKNVLFLYINNIQSGEGYHNNMFREAIKKCDVECLIFDITPESMKSDQNQNQNYHYILEPLLNFINNDIASMLNIDYIMLISGDDTTLVLQDYDNNKNIIFADELINRFESYSCEMLICGAVNSYPTWQGKAKGFENNVARWSRHHQHINSNIFMIKGGLENFQKYINLVHINYQQYTLDISKWSFQAALREIHMEYYPNIKVDSLSKIWTRVDDWLYDI